VKNFYFKDRNGQTPLPDELKRGLIPKHIQTVAELDEYEEANIAEGLNWLERKAHKDFLKYDFWLKLHNKLYCDVWKWAGEIRKHELDNPYFNLPYQIWPSLKKLEDDIKFWLENRTYSEKELAARIHERLLTIHPFNNGNGRFSRILTEYICEKLGWPVPNWGQILKMKAEQRRNTYIESLNHARNSKKYDLLINFMYS